VIYDPAPNALATGTNEKNAAICVTTGLLTLLDREQTQGVVAHEMAHIRNEDILLMTLVSILLGGIALLADWPARLLQFALGPAGTEKPTAFSSFTNSDRFFAAYCQALGDGGVATTRIFG
jgi:heat shock protein HtpX